MSRIRFILLWLVLTVFFSLFNSSFVPSEIVIQLINAFLFTLGFYINYEYLIKPFLYNGKIGKFILFYLLLTAVLSLVSMLSVYQVYVYQKREFYVDNYWNETVFYTSNYMLILLVTATLSGIAVLNDKLKTQSLLEKLEKEKISTELEFLKAQINPHFLFNSLNNILFQIDKTNKEARETLLKFSEMLRFQLYACSSDRIEIEKELEYLRNFVEMQMLRKSDKYSCELKVSENVKNIKIAPLLLIPFVENAFKYISNHSNARNEIQILIDYKENEFHFSVTNDKDNLIPISINENKGIGLANVKRRLELLYPGNYELDIANLANQFHVHLKLKAI